MSAQCLKHGYNAHVALCIKLHQVVMHVSTCQQSPVPQKNVCSLQNIHICVEDHVCRMHVLKTMYVGCMCRIQIMRIGCVNLDSCRRVFRNKEKAVHVCLCITTTPFDFIKSTMVLISVDCFSRCL